MLQDAIDLGAIAERALAATASRFVMLTRFDSVAGEIQVAAMAGLGSGVMQHGLKAARRMFPDFDPLGVRFPVDINPLNQAVYREGKAVSASLREVAKGVVDHRIIAVTMTIVGASHVLVVPIKVQGVVVGALSFHSARPLNEAERHLGESLAAQATR